MAPNAGDRHFRVFRVPASVFQVPVGGDGRPLADVLRGERAPMDALHRRPEAACPNVWQRIGVSEHDGRQAGAGPRSRNRLRAWERARRFMGTAVRPSFLTDRRDDMGVASFRNAARTKCLSARSPAPSTSPTASPALLLLPQKAVQVRSEDIPYRLP